MFPHRRCKEGVQHSSPCKKAATEWPCTWKHWWPQISRFAWQGWLASGPSWEMLWALGQDSTPFPHPQSQQWLQDFNTPKASRISPLPSHTCWQFSPTHCPTSCPHRPSLHLMSPSALATSRDELSLQSPFRGHYPNETTDRQNNHNILLTSVPDSVSS